MSPDVPFTTVTKQHTHCVTAVVLCCHCAFHIAARRYSTHLSLSPSINSVPCCSLHRSNKAAHNVSLLLCCAVTVPSTLPPVVTATTFLSPSINSVPCCSLHNSNKAAHTHSVTAVGVVLSHCLPQCRPSLLHPPFSLLL
jgi:hypothetical protein